MKIVQHDDVFLVKELLKPIWAKANDGQNLSSKQHNWGFLVYEGDEVVGGISGYVKRDWFYVDDLVVNPSVQSRGIGEQLIRHSEAYARTLSVVGMHLKTFSASRFYEKMGFEEFGRLDDYPRGSSLVFYLKRF